MVEPDQVSLAEESADLIEMARIYSRPEALCFASALEGGGVHTYTMGFDFGALPHETVAFGGYSVRVPAWQAEQAVSLIDELRLQTSPPAPAKSLRNRIWALAALLAAMGCANAFVAWKALDTYDPYTETENRRGWPLAVAYGFLGILAYPFPVRMPGDYRTRGGRMMQIR